MKLFAVISVLFFLLACNNVQQDEVAAGGGCTYKSIVHKARLINFKQVDSINIDAIFEVAWSSTKDTFTYYQKKGNYLTKNQILQDTIKVGNNYQYIEDIIVSGSCNPHSTHLEMKKIEL